MYIYNNHIQVFLKIICVCCTRNHCINKLNLFMLFVW